ARCVAREILREYPTASVAQAILKQANQTLYLQYRRSFGVASISIVLLLALIAWLGSDMHYRLTVTEFREARKQQAFEAAFGHARRIRGKWICKKWTKKKAGGEENIAEEERIARDFLLCLEARRSYLEERSVLSDEVRASHSNRLRPGEDRRDGLLATIRSADEFGKCREDYEQAASQLADISQAAAARERYRALLKELPEHHDEPSNGPSTRVLASLVTQAEKNYDASWFAEAADGWGKAADLMPDRLFWVYLLQHNFLEAERRAQELSDADTALDFQAVLEKRRTAVARREELAGARQQDRIPEWWATVNARFEQADERFAAGALEVSGREYGHLIRQYPELGPAARAKKTFEKLQAELIGGIGPSSFPGNLRNIVEETMRLATGASKSAEDCDFVDAASAWEDAAKRIGMNETELGQFRNKWLRFQKTRADLDKRLQEIGSYTDPERFKQLARAADDYGQFSELSDYSGRKKSRAMHIAQTVDTTAEALRAVYGTCAREEYHKTLRECADATKGLGDLKTEGVVAFATARKLEDVRAVRRRILGKPKDLLAKYLKAIRDARDDEDFEQLKLWLTAHKAICSELGVPAIGVEGYEGDLRTFDNGLTLMTSAGNLEKRGDFSVALTKYDEVGTRFRALALESRVAEIEQRKTACRLQWLFVRINGTLPKCRNAVQVRKKRVELDQEWSRVDEHVVAKGLKETAQSIREALDAKERYLEGERLQLENDLVTNMEQLLTRLPKEAKGFLKTRKKKAIVKEMKLEMAKHMTKMKNRAITAYTFPDRINQLQQRIEGYTKQ
ncbi:MAG: hypothetical protein HN341_14485, partial [Verrucomicrobia bacterium]|nr:hypothetical protein [Verrucomicrobiota bacterium]